MTLKTPADEDTPASYAGSQQCAGCHAEKASAWQKTAHANSLKKIEGGAAPAFPAGTSPDRTGEQVPFGCARCHTTGFDPDGAPQGGLAGMTGAWPEDGRDWSYPYITLDFACLRCHTDQDIDWAEAKTAACLSCH